MKILYDLDTAKDKDSAMRFDHSLCIDIQNWCDLQLIFSNMFSWFLYVLIQESLQDPTNWIIAEARKRRQANEQPKGKAPGAFVAFVAFGFLCCTSEII